MRPLLSALLAGLACALATASVAADLPDAVAHIMRVHKIPSSGVSIVVQAVDEDTPRLEFNADEARNPASTIKLVTTWTALDLLGPTHTWPTRLYALGPLEDGVLKGDLLLKGYGDPYLVLEDFWKMLGELRRRGVRDIEGDLVIDDTLWATDESDPAAFDGDGFRLYNTLPRALMVNFQAIEFQLDPDPGAGRLRITTYPALPNLTITNQVRLKTGECRGNAPRIFMEQAGPDAPDHIVFSGDMPFSCRNYQLNRSAMTPESYAFGVFKTLWEQWGGTIAGGARRGALGGKRRPLVTWRSRHLSEVIRPLNKWSNNLMTRMLLYAIGEARLRPPIARDAAARVLREHLESRGLDTTQLVVDNGSGLSRDTRVTARFLVDLLRLAWHEPTMPEFVASLSIAGKDGTARRRFRGAREAGRMHLKTGSLQNVSAIAGYVHAPDGRIFAVAMLANAPGVNYGIGKDLQNAVLAWAFRQ